MRESPRREEELPIDKWEERGVAHGTDAEPSAPRELSEAGQREWEMKEMAERYEKEKDAQKGLFKWDKEITERQVKDLEQRIKVDYLTGASSREAFWDNLDLSFKLIRGEITEQRKGVEPLKEISLIFIDLDNFKSVNDTLGHDEGDIVLKKVVSLLAGVIRHKEDMLARLGGDEFVVLLPNMNEEHALAIAEKLRTVLAGDEELKGVTASIGVSSVDSTTDIDPTTLLKRADAAGYVSKESGRNRVTVFREGMKMRERKKKEE